MAKIKLENVDYIYGIKTPFEIKALDNVTVEFAEGKINGLIGHTGSGKSSLVQLLNGLEKPTSGRVLLDGVDIWEKPKNIPSIRFRVGLVMQYPEYQLFEETVEKDIAFGPKNMGLTSEEISKRVSQSIGFVGIEPDMLTRSPFDLSGGQKRRVAIAGVMAMSPEILVLDEPAAGLDPGGRKNIFEGIRRYAREKNATVIIVSHSMEDMAAYCDFVTVLDHGKLLMQGNCSEIFSHSDLLEKSGLDIPEITKLMTILKSRGLPVGDGIYTLDEAEGELLRAFRNND